MWNYRIIKTVDEISKEEWLEICEVYYDTVGKPMGYCKATVGGNNLEEVRSTLDMMKVALDKPTLKFDKEPDENINT
jgi:hypothetical protein